MGPRTVCIVDDDSALRDALSFAMSTQGYDVLEFADADMALRFDGLPIAACLVIDQRLPRMEGLHLIQSLRARGLGAMAILITSNPAPSLRARCDRLGVLLIEKPLIEDDLTLAIERAFGGS